MQHVIIDLFIFIFHNLFFDSVINTKQIVPESWYHKELLQHAVHIADTTQVFKTDVLLKTFICAWRGIVPMFWTFYEIQQRLELILDKVAKDDGRLFD